jgi:hypothetical protein
LKKPLDFLTKLHNHDPKSMSEVGWCVLPITSSQGPWDASLLAIMICGESTECNRVLIAFKQEKTCCYFCMLKISTSSMTTRLCDTWCIEFACDAPVYSGKNEEVEILH